jgi:hypothetical protein
MSSARLEIRKLIVWSYVAPVASVWGIVSFLPVVGLLQKDISATALVAELLFLATGLIGVGGVAAGLSLLVAPEHRSALPKPLRGRPGVIAVYTTVWLVAYAAFQIPARG